MLPEIEAGVLAQAQAEGRDVPHYLQNLVHGQIIARSVVARSRPAYELSPEEWMAQFEVWTNSHAGNTVVLPDEATERKSFYGDCGL